MSRSPRRVYLPRHTDDHLPHGYPPRDAANRLWHRIETVSFLACLFLFSRAFISPVGRGSTQKNHLLFNDASHIPTLFPRISGGPDANNNTILMTTQSFDTRPDALKPHYDKSKDPLSWNSPFAVNMTDLISGFSKSNLFTPNPSLPSEKNDQDSAVLRFDAPPRQGYKKDINFKSSVSSISKTANPPSLSINSRIVRKGFDFMVTRATPRQLDDELDQPIVSSPTPFVLAPETSEGIKSQFDGEPFPQDDEAPFFSMEEFDDDGEIFALKIWINKKEHLQAKLGKLEYCQASSGIRCLSVEK